ncbi:MAG TPA: hypothetical protein VGP22_04640 [Albitalea sp.]|nr:hypothetical protein [Albitalea sp.]
MLLLLGAAAGVAGVMVVQQRYLPPRLSVEESATLRSAFDRAEAERLRLQRELGDTAKRLDAALADRKRLGDELSGSRDTAERLRDVVTSVVASLPPDPRGGAVEVRAARFSADKGALAYDVVLTRERSGGKPLSGVMQLLVVGASARGTETTATLKPVAISVASYESLRGSMPLPDGFKPRQTTINLLDRVDGKLLGRRVIFVK